MVIQDEMNHLSSDVLIIGGGMAACFAAVEAKRNGMEVLMVDKGRVGFSGTSPRCGGGGTGWVLFPPEFGGDPRDSHDVMLSDCVKGGEFLNIQENTEIFNVESLERFLESESLGVRYRRTPEGKYTTMRTMAYSYPRGGSSAAIGGSQVIMRTIREQVIGRQISLLENTIITRLLTEKGQVIGVCGINTRTGEFYSINTKAIILASGSATGLYKYPTCVNELTGDSYALAFNAGATLMNMEFLQFSITAMIKGMNVRGVGGIKPLVASGAKWVNSTGEAFMKRYDSKRLEFTDWWRNIHSIYREYEEGRGPVYLDLSGIPEKVRQRWEDNASAPYNIMFMHGLNPRRDRLELVPGLHTFLGGMRINPMAESSVAGLYGAGEAAGQAGVFGSDRVGSGIAAAQVFGHRAGKYAAGFARKTGANATGKTRTAEEKDRINSFLRNKGEDPFDLENKIKELAYEHLGISRTASGLKKAVDGFSHLRREGLGNMKASNILELVKALEVYNLALTGEMVARSALLREESRGQHRREDYPETDNQKWLKWITINKSDEDMEPGFIPVPIDKYKVKPEPC